MAIAPRLRVVLDNDWSGDPDGLFQLAHHLLSPSVDVRLVIGSHLREGDVWATTGRTADEAARIAGEIAALCGRDDVTVLAGANGPMTDPATPQDTPAARALVEEAMRDDPRPLVACFGGALTTIASALLIEPLIAERLTLAWIGGPEYPGVALPPDPMPVEYNLLADIPAARSVFAGGARLWQIPRDAYRQTLMSQAELDRRVRPHGPLGARLAGSIDTIRGRMAEFGRAPGETYIYGDSPLVLVTALQSEFEPDPSSSHSSFRPAPVIREDGTPDFDRPGRMVRVFDRLDTRLMFEDLFAKLEAHTTA